MKKLNDIKNESRHPKLLLSEEILPKEERYTDEELKDLQLVADHYIGVPRALTPLSVVRKINQLKYHKALLAAEEQVRCYKSLYEESHKESMERADTLIEANKYCDSLESAIKGYVDKIQELQEEVNKLKGLIEEAWRHPKTKNIYRSDWGVTMFESMTWEEFAKEKGLNK